MRIIKSTVLSFLLAFMLIGVAQAEDGSMKGVKLGFGFDRGFGIVGSMGTFNGFIGNDGVAVDYLFVKNSLNAEGIKAPMSWYVGGGGFGDWDGDFGVRLPVGIEMGFAERLDGYGQIIPRFRVNNNADFGLDFALGVRYAF